LPGSTVYLSDSAKSMTRIAATHTFSGYFSRSLPAPRDTLSPALITYWRH
jgi:hypothetical protein